MMDGDLSWHASRQGKLYLRNKQLHGKTGGSKETHDQAQQCFSREALKIQAFMAKQGKTVTLERINVEE